MSIEDGVGCTAVFDRYTVYIPEFSDIVAGAFVFRGRPPHRLFLSPFRQQFPDLSRHRRGTCHGSLPSSAA